MDPGKLISIGLVGPLPPPSGGMANQTRQLAGLLTDSAIAVEIVQVNAPYRPTCVGTLRGVRAVFRLVPYLLRLWRCAGRVDLFHVMANSGWAWHLCAAPAVWIARLRGVPVVINYRGGEAEAFLGRQAFWVRPTLRRAFAVIVPSGFLQRVFEQFGVTAEIVSNIVDLSRFHPGPPRAASRRIIVTRNLEDIYDIPTALRAFAEIRRVHSDATLAVAGSGPRLAELQQLAQALGIAASVRFTGRIDNEHIAELYRGADLLLNPSTADNMPISLLEAMASAVPIVTTNVGGIPHLVTDARNALLVAPRDPAAMAAAALRVFADQRLAHALAQAGTESAASYTWAQVKPRLFGVYARAIGVPSLNHCAT
ncbi:MAG: glycosyltransferase family 4 protein [Betaproteobacteria bacterium]